MKTLYYNYIRYRQHEKAAKVEFDGVKMTGKRVLPDNY